MANVYTYDDFVKAANGAGMLNAFSQDDLTISQRNPEYGLSLLKLQQDAAKATTSEQKLLAQEAVNQLRKTYTALPASTAEIAETPATSTPAASTTASGTASSAVPNSGTGYTYSGETAYQKALEGVTQNQPYSYDHKTDSTYGQLSDTYLADNQASQNQLLSNPAVSGSGSTPSYAGAAAGQSANYYAGKLNDIIPQLEQNAYEQYLKDFQIKNSQLDAATQDKQLSYDQWKQQQEMEMAALQQKYANDLILHQTFGQAAPTMPDLSGIGTSGTSGSTMVPEYTYGKQTAYQDALDAVLNNPEFSWTLQNDPAYASLRKSFQREGQRATEDALARASAGSMGIPSSYAIRQAADAGNGYNEQLMNSGMGLQENAYSRYLSDFQNQFSTLGQLTDDRKLDYEQWLQDYQLQQKAQQQAFDNAVALYKATGKLTPEIAAALGIAYTAPKRSSSSKGNLFNASTIDDAVYSALQSSPYLPTQLGHQAEIVNAVNSAVDKAQSSGKITSTQANAIKKNYSNRFGSTLRA